MNPDTQPSVDDSAAEGAAPAGDDAHAAKMERCQELIGYRFRDRRLLLEALTHASGAAHRLASNERMEFLGDSVLGLVVCEWVYCEHPEASEGDLTRVKSAVVSRRACARAARQLGLDECLIVGKGVTRNRSFPRSLASDVFESVVAAVFLDGGLEAVRPLIREWLAGEVELAVKSQGAGNYKSMLQQLVQRESGSTPVYRLLSEKGPDHSKLFCVAAQVDEREFTPAWGRNKKDAEQRAAGNALAELNDQQAPYPEP